MSFLKVKFDFLKKIEYITLYYYTLNVYIYNKKKIIFNYLNFHSEIIFLYNFFMKKKNIFFHKEIILSKIICFYCLKKSFLIKKCIVIKNFLKKKFLYKKKIFFWVVSSDW